LEVLIFIEVILMNFSIDMLRLKVKSTSEDLQRFFQGILNSGATCCDYYQSFNIKEFRHNFSFKEDINENPFVASDVQRFWCGFDHNSQKSSNYTYLYIEFNPNKCDITKGYLNLILRTFFTSFTSVYVCSCDVCLDLPDVSIDSFFFDRCLKRYTCDMRSEKGRTIYLGAPGSNGRIKIYDKASERGLKDTVLTRYEVSLKFDNLLLKNILLGKFDYGFDVPDVYFYDKLDMSEFNDVNMRSYIFSIMCGFTKINDYSRKTKQKIKQTLDQSASFKKINCENKQFVTNTIITYFKNYIKFFQIEFDSFYWADENKTPVKVVVDELSDFALKQIEKMSEKHKNDELIRQARRKHIDDLEKKYREDCQKLPSYDELMAAYGLGKYSQ
jgi:hypothetical protein